MNNQPPRPPGRGTNKGGNMDLYRIDGFNIFLTLYVVLIITFIL